MEKPIPEGSSVKNIRDMIKNADHDSIFYCAHDQLFELAKMALVAEKKAGITVQLIDQHDYVVKEVTSKRRADMAPSQQLNDRQMSVIRALEKVLEHCQMEGIQLIGFSDELVAQPAHLNPSEGVSPFALGLQTYSVYRGAESLKKIY